MRCLASVTALMIGAGFSLGCGANAAKVRVLHGESPTVHLPETSPDSAEPVLRDTTSAPRIGAPGGSGAGSRRVAPAQSGNDTVGGLPAGIGAGVGPAGRG